MMKNVCKISLLLYVFCSIIVLSIFSEMTKAQDSSTNVLQKIRASLMAQTQTAEAQTQAEIPTNVLQEIQNKGILTVGMEPDALPMNYIDENNQRQGFDYELVLEIAKKTGISKVAIKEADYEVLPELLRRREIDIIMGGYVPDPSIENVEWSKGYYEFGLCLIVRESSAIRKVSHLKGKTVAIYNDPAAEEWVLENIPDVTIEKYSGDSGWFEAVEEGDVDALIYDYPFAATEIKDYPKTQIVEFNLNESYYAIGVLTKNYDLLDELNAALDSIIASPKFGQLVRKYFAYESKEYTKPVSAGQKSYTVKPGDMLSTIALRELGSSSRWREIWELNKTRIPNPDLIQPGWVLIMP